MAQDRSRVRASDAYTQSRSTRFIGATGKLAVLLVVLLQIPVVSAHGEAESTALSQSHGLAAIFVGLALVGGAVALKRTERITPTTALYAAFAGLAVVTIGAMVFDGLAPDASYSASTMPIPRSWYPPMALLTGVGIAIVSFAVGWLKWPGRPRYTSLGILIGFWVAYPTLIPGSASTTNPLGYVIVLATPVLLGYIVWKDAQDGIRVALHDATARRFGIGVGFLLAVYFSALSGYLTFFPSEGSPHHTIVAIETVQYQLVQWPTLEVFLPQVPFFVAVSIGSVVLVGSLSTLVGLNAALIAYQWRSERVAIAGTTEGTAGTSAIVGSCACGCCGPIVAQIVVLVAGPSIAAPLYWVFVDTKSPFMMLFLVASIGLFTGGLVYATKQASGFGAPGTSSPAAVNDG